MSSLVVEHLRQRLGMKASRILGKAVLRGAVLPSLFVRDKQAIVENFVCVVALSQGLALRLPGEMIVLVFVFICSLFSIPAHARWTRPYNHGGLLHNGSDLCEVGVWDVADLKYTIIGLVAP